MIASRPVFSTGACWVQMSHLARIICSKASKAVTCTVCSGENSEAGRTSTSTHACPKRCSSPSGQCMHTVPTHTRCLTSEIGLDKEFNSKHVQCCKVVEDSALEYIVYACQGHVGMCVHTKVHHTHTGNLSAQEFKVQEQGGPTPRVRVQV